MSLVTDGHSSDVSRWIMKGFSTVKHCEQFKVVITGILRNLLCCWLSLNLFAKSCFLLLFLQKVRGQGHLQNRATGAAAGRDSVSSSISAVQTAAAACKSVCTIGLQPVLFMYVSVLEFG